MSVKVEHSIRQAHSQITEAYENVQSEVRQLLQAACRINKWVFDDRMKSVESYALKLVSGRYDGYYLDDFYACTIVVPNLNGIPDARELVEKSFKILSEKPGAETYAWPTEFSFDSTRIYCSLKESVKQQKHRTLKFEIQIKTLLEYAWSKATHDFSYKGDDVSWAKERLSAQIKAVLDNVDLSIFEMDKIASSDFLDKRNPRYEKLKSIVRLLENEFGVEGDSVFAGDRKRLAESIERILARAGISTQELEESLKLEKIEGRGSSLRNLSVYSIVLLALIKRFPKRMKDALQKRPPGKNPQNTVIPYEVINEWDVDSSNFRNVTILGRYDSA